jgi:hypothetical protein
MNTALEYSTRVVQEGDRRCKKSTLNDLAYLTPLRIPLRNPVVVRQGNDIVRGCFHRFTGGAQSWGGQGRQRTRLGQDESVRRSL